MFLRLFITILFMFMPLIAMEDPAKQLENILERRQSLPKLARPFEDCWVWYSDTSLAEYNNKEYLGPDYNDTVRIRRRDSYLPSNAQNDAKLFWLVVHGTSGQDTRSFYDDITPGFPNYGYIKEAAAWYATQRKRPIELLSVVWSGGLSHPARKALGNAIAHFVDKVNDGNNTVILAHSHGCNGSSYASRKINPQKPIALLIYFACPRRPEEYYEPLHYKQLIHFHSSADIIAPLGRIPEERNTEFGLSSALVLFGAGNVLKYLAQTILQGITPIEQGRIANIWRAVNTLSIYYLARCISGDKWIFIDQEAKITQNLLTTLDNQSPNHSTIVDAVKFLPTILDKLLDKRPRYFITFDLNVAMSKNQDDPIAVSIREHSAQDKPTTKPAWCTVM